jgi:hypothetical protein
MAPHSSLGEKTGSCFPSPEKKGAATARSAESAGAAERRAKAEVAKVTPEPEHFGGHDVLACESPKTGWLEDQAAQLVPDWNIDLERHQFHFDFHIGESLRICSLSHLGLELHGNSPERLWTRLPSPRRPA